ncbi:MAG: non-homologous end-joining DNA ligase [Candidatus Eremiobacteraeota bacterium]|nr:non-homologous end-joining DNA ligase [Candidatus Eremiobacteraeota bacterium]
MSAVQIPRDRDDAVVSIGRRTVQLTNLRKPFWPKLGISKGDLLRYYVDVAGVLLPNLKDRAMVMKRYPHGAEGEFFFMKRTPDPHPEWLQTCRIEHGSGNVIAFPMINDVPALLWVINLGCIDLNQWYARCDDIDRPDYLHFDLDPGSAPFSAVREVALVVRDGLEGLKMPAYVKTSGSKGMHVYVPIRRGPLQKEVWTFAKAFAQTVAKNYPELATAQYKKESRPKGRVLVDYNQNRWGSTLASVYSVRPTPQASVSAPVTWDEVREGCAIEDFRIDNMRERLAEAGDLWAPVHRSAGRFDLSPLVEAL